eukprot:30999-Ditylum_brightwellii.AAC.2
MLCNEVYASNVKEISIKLLHVGLEGLCSDIDNVCVKSYTTEHVYAIAGPDFGSTLEGKIVVIQKTLYGLATFVWIRIGDDKTSCEYICTHIEAFCIFLKRTCTVMEQIKAAYMVKSVGLPECYLNKDYKHNFKGQWNIGCKM